MNDEADKQANLAVKENPIPDIQVKLARDRMNVTKIIQSYLLENWKGWVEQKKRDPRTSRRRGMPHRSIRP